MRTCHLHCLSLISALLVTLITRCPAVGQGTDQVGIPSPHFGAGPIHVVVINKLHTPKLHNEVTETGAVISEIDYENIVICRVDENRLGGRKALQSFNWPIHDELDLVALSGYILNATNPAPTLLKLPIDETFGDPLSARLHSDAGLYIVKLAGSPKDEWLTALQETGSHIVHYMAMNAYVVACSAKNVVLLQEYSRLMPYVTTVLPLHQAWRMSPEVQAARQSLVGRLLPITIQVVRRPNIRETLEQFRELASGSAQHSPVGPYINLHVDMDPTHFLTVASHPDVFNIERRHARVRNDEVQGQISAGNVSGNSPIGPGYLSWLSSQGFGSGQFSSFSVNVVDDSDSLTGHPDLPSSRIAFQNDPTNQTGQQEGHGFLNAHIVGGYNDQSGSAYNDSAGYNYGLGIAPWAHVGVTAIFGNGSASSSSWESTAYSQGARISTNSWGYNYAYTYDSNAQEYDYLVRDARSNQSGNQELSILFAAGNDGSSSNTVGSPGTAKNVLTVGASENVRQTGNDGCGIGNSGANSINDIISFSSRAPVNSSGGDGRWKPESSSLLARTSKLECLRAITTATAFATSTGHPARRSMDGPVARATQLQALQVAQLLSTSIS